MKHLLVHPQNLVLSDTGIDLTQIQHLIYSRLIRTPNQYIVTVHLRSTHHSAFLSPGYIGFIGVRATNIEPTPYEDFDAKSLVLKLLKLIFSIAP